MKSSGGACPFAVRSQPVSQPAATCPLGFGAGSGPNGSEQRPTPATFAGMGLPRMPLAVLAGHPTLVAVKGVVFDVSDVEPYQTRLAGWGGGHDVSRQIAVSGRDDGDRGISGEGLDGGLEGLRYEDHQRLEAYFLEMARTVKAVAVLTEEDHTRIFGAPLVVGGDAAYSPATASLAPKSNINASGHGVVAATLQPTLAALVAELHSSVEQGDEEAVAGVLARHKQHCGDADAGEIGRNKAEDEAAERKRMLLVVDSACPRTGMTPLLKAVEAGLEAVVRVLLEAGANVRTKVRVACCGLHNVATGVRALVVCRATFSARSL